MKNKLTSVRIIMLLPLLLIASLAFHGVSVAEPPPFYWEFINVDIDVQENGDMLITETQKYVFTGPYTNERHRYIPLDKVDRIDSVQFFEKGVERFVTTDVKNNQFWIRWRHTLDPPESHTFILKYRVIGGLRMMMPDDHLKWEAILRDRPAPIQRAKVSVRLPDSLAGVHLRSKAFGVPATTRMVDTQTVEFVPRGPVPPGRGLQVQVVFPHGLLGPRDLPRGIGVDLDNWILELALLIVVSAVSLHLFARRTSGVGTKSWECGCGIVNKGSRTKCIGCGTPQGMVWTPDGFKTPDEAQVLAPLPPGFPANAPNFSALPVTIHTVGSYRFMPLTGVNLGDLNALTIFLLIGMFLPGFFSLVGGQKILGGFFLLAAAVITFVALQSRRTVRIDKSEIRTTKLPLFGRTETLVEPVSAFKGVLLRTRTQSSTYGGRTRDYEVLLVHPDPKKTILVYQIGQGSFSGDEPERKATLVWLYASDVLNLLKLKDID